MCRDSDLFGDVIVTLDDVELWMMSLPNFTSDTPITRIENYIINHPVSSIIKNAKLQGYFYNLRDLNPRPPIRCFNPVYVELYPAKQPPCDNIFHTCENVDCDVFKRNVKRAKNRLSYKKWKLKRCN